MNRWAGLWCAAAIILHAPVNVGMGPSAFAKQEPEGFVLRVAVDQIILNVTVREDDALITDLEAGDFEVLDEGVPQQIDFFERGSVPASIGIVLDNSRSIRANRDLIAAAALQFLRQLGPDDEVFVIHFSDDVVPVPTPDGGVYSSDRETLESAVERLRPIGITRLYDAVARGLDLLEEGRWERQALIVLGDGGDNGSRIESDALERRIEQSEAPVFSIGLVDPRWSEVDPDKLVEFSDKSGGEAFLPRRIQELPRIWSRIATLIHSQYTLGYTPRVLSPGFHEIEVRVPGRNYDVRTRTGYLVSDPDIGR